MKIVRVDNLTYYVTLFGTGFFLLSTAITLINAIYFESFFLICLSGAFLHNFLRAKKYRIELSKGMIREITQTKTSEISFSTITQLDCKEIDSGDSRNFHAIFLLQTENGPVEFETNLQASLFDIALWVRDNYPSAIFTKKLNKYLAAPHSKTFFGSKK